RGCRGRGAARRRAGGHAAGRAAGPGPDGRSRHRVLLPGGPDAGAAAVRGGRGQAVPCQRCEFHLMAGQTKLNTIRKTSAYLMTLGLELNMGIIDKVSRE